MGIFGSFELFADKWVPLLIAELAVWAFVGKSELTIRTQL
jgi:hypothetical protein